MVRVNEAVASKVLAKGTAEWSQQDVELAITDSVLCPKSHMKTDLLQDGGSGAIIVPSLHYCCEILEVLPDIVIQVANDQYTQVTAEGMMKMRVVWSVQVVETHWNTP